jgi:hypothetical protein
MDDSQEGAAEMRTSSEILAGKIAAAKARHRAFALATGAGRAMACFWGVLLVAALLDWRLDLPRGVRIAILLADGAAALYLLVRRGVLPAARGMDDETVALAVERQQPRFGTRLIAAVQLARPGALRSGESTAVVDALLQETEAAAGAVDFRLAIPAAAARRAAMAAAIILAAGLILFLLGGTHSRPLLARQLGAAIPWPSQTQVEVTSGSFLVALGDGATLRARASGRKPDSGVAQITFASGRRQTVTLSRVSDSDYTGALENVPEPFTYSGRLNDSASDAYSVDAQPRPMVTSLACTQVFPAYTGIGETRRDPADLLLLAGSKLRLRIAVNRDLKAGSRIEFAGRGTGAVPAAIGLQADPAAPRTWLAEFQPGAELTGFSIRLIDTLGLESHSEPTYPIRLTNDRAPTLRVTRPELRQLLATADATCTINFSAEDDFGLAALSLRYRVDDQSEVTVPLPLPPGQKEAKVEFAWRLRTLTPPPGHPSLEGSVLDFHIEARDINPAGTGTAASEHYQIRIVSKADKQSELIARMAASFAGIQELGDRQSKAAADLRAAALEPPPAAQTQPGGDK